MEPFIKSYEYNFIKAQAQTLINGHASVNDIGVLNAIKALAIERVLNLFLGITDEQRQLLNPIIDIEDTDHAERFLSQLKPYVIPFKNVTEQSIKKLFPKAKKLKIPVLEEMDLKEITYLGWDDKGSNRKYIVVERDQKLTGLQGTFKSLNKKGICALCNKFEEVGLFMSEIKGTVQGTYTKRGNYICQDSYKCNQNLAALDKLNDFIERVKG